MAVLGSDPAGARPAPSKKKKIMDYFSYKHFYVLYCRFWELDTDHDGVISRYACSCQVLTERPVPTSTLTVTCDNAV